jgi:hypothetical protein
MTENKEEFVPQASNFDISDELGATGLKQYGGVIYEEFSRKLQGQYAQKVYREMSDNSSTIGSIRYLIKSLTRQVEWRIEPANDSPEAVEQAEFVEGCLDDMEITLEDFISEALSFLDYGWAYFETVYKLRKGDTGKPETESQFDDGKYGWRKFGLRAQDTLDHWELDPKNSEIYGMHQQTEDGQEAYIPSEKAMLFRTEVTKNNPEGRSIYRNAVVDWYYLKRISEIEAIGIERDLAGLPTMQVPPKFLSKGATAAEKGMVSALAKMLSEIKRDERGYAIVPSELTKDNMPTQFKFELLGTGGSRQIDTNSVKEYYKVSILQSVLAQFIQLGMGASGSWALASSQTNLFSVALGAYLGIMTSTFNRQGINRLMKMNEVDQELWPKLVHGDIESPSLEEVGKYIVALNNTGNLPLDETIQRKLLEIGNLPIPELSEDDMLEDQEVPEIEEPEIPVTEEPEIPVVEEELDPPGAE